jgi:hypothetical protein
LNCKNCKGKQKLVDYYAIPHGQLQQHVVVYLLLKLQTEQQQSGRLWLVGHCMNEVNPSATTLMDKENMELKET